jgi:hypothetical protein
MPYATPRPIPVHSSRASSEPSTVRTDDEVVFAEAVYQSQLARKARRYAWMIRGGCTVYGWTVDYAQKEARRAERVVRNLANQSLAKAGGAA